MADYGCDSTDRADRGSSITGTQTRAQWAQARWGTGAIHFWARYFQPSPTATEFNQEPGFQDELNALITIGCSRLLPLSSPGNTNINDWGTGFNTGTTTVNGIIAIIQWSRRPEIGGMTIQVSANPTPSCMVYLDVEDGALLAPEYWRGWAGAVRGKSYLDPNLGYYIQPFYPALYCNPNTVTNNPCATLCAEQNTFGVWSSQPSGYSCAIPGPAWGAYSCGSCSGPGYLGTRAWQYSISPSCGWNADTVDLDMLNPGWNELQNMIYFHY